MEYTAQNLEYAVCVFYQGEQAERAKAHLWLTTAQRAPEAWKFVWELLQPNKRTEVQFYAATTLHTKILRCWNELPPESYEELKQKILEAVTVYSNGPKIVTNRLCISLAAFILQQGTVDLAAILRPLATVENTSLLIEVLTVIPEEFNSMTMGAALRAKNRAMLRDACPAVLGDLMRYLQTVYDDFSKEPPPEEMVRLWQSAAACAGTWFSIGAEDTSALPDHLPLCRALMTVVHLLYTRNTAVSDGALDACEACLGAVRTAGGSPGAVHTPAAALQLLHELADLAAPIVARDNVPDSINEELLSALVTTAVVLCECHATSIVSAVEGREAGAGGEERAAALRRLLEVLLAVQAAPGHYPVHETRSNLVFGLWYTLQDEVLILVDSKHSLSPIWRELYAQLLAALLRKSEAPPDDALSRDDLEMLRCYRQDLADTAVYCFGILGDCCWNTVEAAYTAAQTEARREAVLHVCLALADAAPLGRVPPSLAALLEHAVRAAHHAAHAGTLDTALNCIGSYASWLSTVGRARGEPLARACVLAAGAALARSPAAAALALRRVCQDCTAAAAPLAADIVRAAQSEHGRSDSWVRRQLLGAAGAALAAADPAAAAPLLQDLAAALRDELAQATDVAQCTSAAESAAALVGALGPQPALLAELLRAVLPTLPRYAHNPALVEPMFHILKQAVITLLDDCMPLLGELAQLVVAGFKTRPCAEGLDVVNVLVVAMSDRWPEAGWLLHGAAAAAARAVQPEPAAAADLAEGLFCTLHALIRKKPQHLDWIEDLLPELIQLGCTCVRLWEASGARAACLWLGALAGQRARALRPAAPALVHSALRCIGGATPRNQIEPLAELLLALNRAQWQGAGGGGAAPEAGGDLGGWLRHALAAPNFPTPHATDAHKHKFIAAVVKEKSSKRRLFETVQEFSLVCRGLIGTEYARQTLASKKRGIWGHGSAGAKSSNKKAARPYHPFLEAV